MDGKLSVAHEKLRLLQRVLHLSTQDALSRLDRLSKTPLLAKGPDAIEPVRAQLLQADTRVKELQGLLNEAESITLESPGLQEQMAHLNALSATAKTQIDQLATRMEAIKNENLIKGIDTYKEGHGERLRILDIMRKHLGQT